MDNGNIFANGRDDYMFPATRSGMAACGMILESACKPKDKEDCVLESAASDYDRRTRSQAMSAVLSWIENGDFDYNSMDETVVVVADIDGDYELTEDEEAEYTDIWNQVPSAMLTLGADIDDVQAFIDGPGKDADGAGQRLGKALVDIMDNMQTEDLDIISGFALDDEDGVFESSNAPELVGVFEVVRKRKKVVEDGKLKIVNKVVSGKVRLSAAQKAALKKARRKAHTASAKLARRKSMKVRKNKGL